MLAQAKHDGSHEYKRAQLQTHIPIDRSHIVDVRVFLCNMFCWYPSPLTPAPGHNRRFARSPPCQVDYSLAWQRRWVRSRDRELINDLRKVEEKGVMARIDAHAGSHLFCSIPARPH